MNVLPPNALRSADFARGDWFVALPNDVTFEQIMTPAFWANHHTSLKLFNRIMVVREDATFSGDFIVTLSAVGMVVLRPMYPPHDDTTNIKAAAAAAAKVEEGGDESEPPEGYLVKHNEAVQGYYVKLKGSGEVITGGQKGISKADALKIAWKHSKAANTPRLARAS